MDNLLLNELIISHIFSYSSLEQLVNYRTVCKKWNYIANSYIRKKKKIEFFGYALKNLNEFLQIMSQTNDFPFGRFGIQIWDTESFRSRYQSIPLDSEYFFTLCGPHIKYLRIGFHDFLDTITVNSFRTWFLSSIPNIHSLELSGLSLRVLTINSIFDKDKDQLLKMDMFPVGLKHLIISDTFGEVEGSLNKRYNENILTDLFKMCPNLDTFVLNTNDLRSSLIPSTISSFNQLSSSYLKKLYLHCIINEQDLRIIYDCHFILNSLELYVIEHDVQKNTLENFLISQKNSLKNLIMGEPESINPHSHTLNLQFHCMEFLTKLCIIRRGPTRKLTFYSNVYTNSFPNLIHLDLSIILNNLVDFFPNNFGENKIIKKLQLPSGFADINLMELILRDFSSLKYLKLICPWDEILKIIWKYGTQLEDLELENICIPQADTFFTGIPNQICEWIQQDNAYFRVNQNFFEVINRQTSIINLQKLQRLYIEFQDNPEPLYYVTDIMGYLAIPQLKQLTSLTIKNSEISTECQEWITQNVSLVHMQIS